MATQPSKSSGPPGLLDDPWSVQEWHFPHNGSTADQLKFLLNYAVLAPSGHNTQPWLFKIAGDEIELYADRTRALPVVDPGDRELVMSCGAALFHLCVAMRHFGYEPVVRTFPDLDDRDLMAFIRLGLRREPTMEDHQLFMAIKRRRTNRMPFDDRPVPETDLERLQEAAQAEGTALHLFTELERKEALALLIAEGDRIQGGNESFRRELAVWIHPNRSDQRDGMPGYAHGYGDLRSLIGPLVVRTFDWGNGQAAHDRQLAEGSPVLMVFSTETDTPPAWLDTGRALDRVLLKACTYDLQVSYLNQPVEVADLRARLSELIGGGIPQLVLRLGYPQQSVRSTPRRPVREVLSRSQYL